MTMQESLDDRRIPRRETPIANEGSPARFFDEMERRPRPGLAQSVSARGTGDTTDSGMQTALFNRLSNISPVTSRDITTLGTEGFLYPRDLMTYKLGQQPAGEMVPERMADRQAGPLMPGRVSTTGDIVNLSNQLGANDYLYNLNADQWITPEAASSMINFPDAAAQAAVADMGRTTTMGTGWEFPTVSQPLIAPPPTYDYTGTGWQPPVYEPTSWEKQGFENPWGEARVYGNNKWIDWAMPTGQGTPFNNISSLIQAGLTSGLSLPFNNPWGINPLGNINPWGNPFWNR